MTDRTAVLLGASGSVGQALLAEIVRCGAFGRIILMTRRPLEVARLARVEQQLLADMRPDALQRAVEDTLRDIGGDVLGFSVLGVGAGTASLSLQEHRAVDVDLNVAFARGLKASGKVRHLAFMSAVGADATARATGSGAAGMPRYLRIKGEAEAAVSSEGPAIVSIFRPAMIIGSKHTPRWLSLVLPLFAAIAPARFRSIRTTEIAGAMVAASLSPPKQSSVFTYPEMMTLIADGDSPATAR